MTLRSTLLMRACLAALSLSTSAVAAEAVAVRVKNPLGSPRPVESVVVHLSDVKRLAPKLEPAHAIVVDAQGALVSSQLVDMDGDETPDDLVFQAALGANQQQSFVIQTGTRRPPSRDDFKVYGRFVRERHDDFAWENDRIAHRMYGPDLETWKKEPLTSSGIDVWCKRTRRLVVNDWYLLDDYHEDHGEGADLYSVGRSRGCGGSGLWQGGKLYVSRNFTASRVLANGPIRLVFELDYAPWDAGGVRVRETKRVILDAGSQFDRFESRYQVEGAARALHVAIGIAKHAGGQAELDKQLGTLRSWEPLKPPNGNLGCALVVEPGAIESLEQTESDTLLVTRAPAGGTVAYYAGFGWDKGGAVTDAASWARAVTEFAERARAPLAVSLSGAAPLASVEGLEPGLSQRFCDSILRAHPGVLTGDWHYDTGLVLKGFVGLWNATHERKYIDYVKRTIDGLLDAQGQIRGYSPEKYSSDEINMGKVLFSLLDYATEVPDQRRYRAALEQLRAQMRTQPRTADGAFWHKQIYPHQMWLDGVYMTSPFLAEYASRFHEPALFDEVATQILLAEKHMRDPKTGLLYHGWDESREQRWANPKTGTSSQFWGRGMGWYAMALVDSLDFLPLDHPKRREVLGVLGRLAKAVASVQDPKSGVWWQVLDAPGRAGNYQEASASAMFVYALSKAVRHGWLDAKPYAAVAARGYQGILKQFVTEEQPGRLSLGGVCKVAGLGGNPYRDGSYAYYTSTEVVANDPKGVGAFILASLERD